MLHITNGDTAGGSLQAAGFSHPILPWRDVLHEGPVRGGLSLEELSEERARFIADAGWGSFDQVHADFRERDEVLRRSAEHDEVVLWFEHDLYDQLQLIQLLDWFSHHPHPKLSLICEAEYVWTMPPARMVQLFAGRRPVTNEQLKEARAAWAAFTSGTPSTLQECSTRGLRFLGQALRRHLEEFPWVSDGVCRLERNILHALREGPLPFARLFPKVREDPAYLGDSVLAWHLERMEREGLLRFSGSQWEFKASTRKHREPRWLGGVRVDEACRWRWDPAAGRLAELL